VKQCGACGAENRDEARFCRECGKRFERAIPWLWICLATGTILLMVGGVFLASRIVNRMPYETAGRDGAPMVLIPAGEFTMGSNDGEANEKPSHRVSISAFYMDKYEVTFDLYDRFCEAAGRAKPSDSGWGRGNRPVINVSWNDATAYANHYGKRLPTEAEWEYACRAGVTGKWCFGDDEGQLGGYAWYSANSGSMTHPVGEKAANAWGLHDMHGNVWEWCADWYDAGYYAASPVQDPTGAFSGQYRVLRGGSWGGAAVDCRSAGRDRVNPWGRFNDGGFRCAASPRAR
jgi:formylglycine-generating enzyme required for sulfatase activity